MKYMISVVIVAFVVVVFLVFARERDDGKEKEYEPAETVIDFISRTQIRVDDELLEWSGYDTAYQVQKRFCGGMRVVRIRNAHRCMFKDVWSLCECGRGPQRGHEGLKWPILFFKLEDVGGKEYSVFAGPRVTHMHTFRFPKPICRIHAEDHCSIDDFDLGARVVSNSCLELLFDPRCTTGQKMLDIVDVFRKHVEGMPQVYLVPHPVFFVKPSDLGLGNTESANGFVLRKCKEAFSRCPLNVDKLTVVMNAGWFALDDTFQSELREVLLRRHGCSYARALVDETLYDNQWLRGNRASVCSAMLETRTFREFSKIAQSRGFCGKVYLKGHDDLSFVIDQSKTDSNGCRRRIFGIFGFAFAKKTTAGEGKCALASVDEFGQMDFR